MIGHRHDFKLVAKSYAAPVSEDHHVNGDSELIKCLRFGITTYTFLCASCGTTMKSTAFGREERGAFEIKFQEVKR